MITTQLIPLLLRNSIVLKGHSQHGRLHTLAKGCQAVEATKPHKQYIYQHKRSLEYSGVGFPTLEFSYVHRTRRQDTLPCTTVPATFSHSIQIGSQPADNFVAKQGPKQKVSFIQRKMFCFKKNIFKKKAVTGKMFFSMLCPKVQCCNFLFQTPTASVRLSINALMQLYF